MGGRKECHRWRGKEGNEGKVRRRFSGREREGRRA